MTSLGNSAQEQGKDVAPQSRACTHCGSPVRNASERFCCAGCEFVFRTIHSLGLTGFYRIRNEGASVPADKVEPGKGYAYLEDNEVASKIVTLDPLGGSIARFYLPTIHCAACVWLLEKLSEVVKGVKNARVSFRSGIIEIEFEPEVISLSELARVLNSIGYPPVPATHNASQDRLKEADRALLRRIGVAAVCAANTMMLADSLFQGAFTGIEEPFRSLLTWASAILALPAVVYSAFPFYRAALGGIIMGSLHIDIPISLAIIASYCSGIFHTLKGDTFVYFDSITSLIFLLLIARYAQSRAIHRSRASTLTSWDLFPALVRVRKNEEVIEKPLRELVIGEVVEVRAGERIPSDGVIVEGVSSVETSFLTGESRPIKIQSGSSVLGASINIESTVYLQVGALGEKSRLGKILAELEKTRDKRTALETRVSKIINMFVLAVLFVTLLTAAVWLWIDSSRAFDIAISLLIVTCPCALGLAIPTAVTVALSRAQRNGIFVKNAEALQVLAEAKHFYFDKTGTLTEGRLRVKNFHGESRIRDLAVTLARGAPLHPVAHAIGQLEFSEDSEEVNDICHVPGRGVQAKLSTGTLLSLGSNKWFKEREVIVPSDFAARILSARETGNSLCLFEENGIVCGLFELDDDLAPEAKEIISELQKGGKQVFILSGDSQTVVSDIAKRLNIPAANAHGDLYPEDKQRILMTDNCVTAMIGDGLNDAHAIRHSSVGIGLSGGIEATLECADIFISQRRLSGFQQLYRGAWATQTVIRRNLLYSIIYNLIGGGLAVTGHISPLVAAILMPVSSLTVVISSMSSKYFVERVGK